MLSILYDKLDPINEVCKHLGEKEYYVVVAALSEHNVTHKSILYTGYSTGGYRCLLNPTYGHTQTDLSTARIKIISKIGDI